MVMSQQDSMRNKSRWDGIGVLHQGPPQSITRIEASSGCSEAVQLEDWMAGVDIVVGQQWFPVVSSGLLWLMDVNGGS